MFFRQKRRRAGGPGLLFVYSVRSKLDDRACPISVTVICPGRLETGYVVSGRRRKKVGYICLFADIGNEIHNAHS